MNNETRQNRTETPGRPGEDIFAKALRFADEKHKGQKRKFTGEIYMVHLAGVAKILVKVTGDPAVLAGGLLHDTLEDTKTTYAELALEFGKEVATLVNDVTEQDKSVAWEPRKLAAIEHMKSGSKKSWLIKSADLIDNITSLNRILKQNEDREKVMNHFGASLDQQLKMALKSYRTLQELWGDNPLLKRLLDAVQEMSHIFYETVHGVCEVEPTPTKPVIDYEREIDRFFDPVRKPSQDEPVCVILMGITGAGKTSIKNLKYAAIHVVVDIGAIFLNLSRGKTYRFGEAFEREMQTIGCEVAYKAISERRNMVLEIIGESSEDAIRLVATMRQAGYKVQLVYVECEVDEAYIRHIRGSVENVSAGLTQEYLHECVIAATQRYLSESKTARLV
jgi:hypothetical protein